MTTRLHYTTSPPEVFRSLSFVYSECRCREIGDIRRVVVKSSVSWAGAAKIVDTRLKKVLE